MNVLPDGGFTSPVFFDKVVVTSGNETTDRVMTGAAVGNLNGVTIKNSIPQLTATAYLNGVPLDPQPSFKWESSNPCVCSVDQNGNCKRVTNTETLGFDSNGATNLSVQASESFLGGLAQITATARRPDGSLSGVRGTINIAVQDHAPRQFTGYLISNNSPVGTPNYYSAVATSQPPSDQT